VTPRLKPSRRHEICIASKLIRQECLGGSRPALEAPSGRMESQHVAKHDYCHGPLAWNGVSLGHHCCGLTSRQTARKTD
jgi:hypothetical protein